MNRQRPTCPDCGKRLRNERALKSHIKDAHSRASAFEKPSERRLLPMAGIWIGVLIAALVAIIAWSTLWP